MSKSAVSGGQYSNSESTNEQAAAQQLERLMAGLPESMLATFAFGFRDPGTFPQVITTDDPSITPSVDAIPHG